MGNEKHRPTDVRVFVANLRSFELVYLPATGQIVTRIAPAAPPALVAESRVGPSSRDRGAQER